MLVLLKAALLTCAVFLFLVILLEMSIFIFVRYKGGLYISNKTYVILSVVLWLISTVAVWWAAVRGTSGVRGPWISVSRR